MRKNKPPHFKRVFYTAAAIIITASSSHAALTAQLGILDLTANGGINPATGLAWQNGDTYRLAFVTSGTILGTSTDISTYNAFVNAAADNSTTYSNLGDVNWSAIVSTSGVNAITNTGTATAIGGVSVWNMNDQIHANDYADLWDGSAQARVQYDENSVKRATNNPDAAGFWSSHGAVFTGTNGDGTANADPMGGDASGNIRYGLHSAEANFWTSRNSGDFDAGGANEGFKLPLYAISDVLTVVPEPSSTALLGLGGIGLILRRRR